MNPYQREVLVFADPELPGDHGSGRNLGPHLAGDAAQLEALVGHGLRVRVHLHAGAAAQAGCRVRRRFCQFLLVAGQRSERRGVGGRGAPGGAAAFSLSTRRQTVST